MCRHHNHNHKYNSPKLSFPSHNFNTKIKVLLLLTTAIFIISTVMFVSYMNTNFRIAVKVIHPDPKFRNKQNHIRFRSHSRTKNSKTPHRSDSALKITTASLTEAEENFDQDQNQNQNQGHEYNYLYPKPWTLIDIKVRYLLNAPICSPNPNPNSSSKSTLKSGSESVPQSEEEDQHEKQWSNFSMEKNEKENKIILMILITSHTSHFYHRDKLRQILPTKELRRLGMRRAFLLGKTFKNQNSYTQTHFELKFEEKKPHVDFQQLKEEQEKNSDLIMGSFKESYRNLTYKNLMGLEWVTRYCSQAQFIVKQDDDVFVDFYQLAHILRPRLRSTNSSFESQIQELPAVLNKILNNTGKFKFIAGMNMGGDVVRDKHEKWFVSKDEHPEESYKDFVSGWAYFTNPQTVKDLLAVSIANISKYFWIDDVHITGTLRDKAKIDLVDLGQLFTMEMDELLCCLNPDPLNAGEINENTDNPRQLKGKDTHYWCHFVIGPPLPYMDAAAQLHRHSKFCYFSQKCLRRSEDYNEKFCRRSDNATTTDGSV